MKSDNYTLPELGAAPVEYEIVIEASRTWWNFRWRECWEYRDLLALLIQRDFTSRYKQTILGPLWFVLQPVMTMLIFVVMFGRVAKIPTEGIPGPLFYLSGLLAWQYFQQNIVTGGATFINHAPLFGKVWFPRLIMPLSIVLSNLISFALQLIPFFLFLLYYKVLGPHPASIQFGFTAFLTLIPLFQIVLLSVGVSLLMAAATAKYRDLVHLTQYVVQLWMFASPTVLSLSMIRERSPWLIWLNPMSVPIESFRLFLLGHGSVTVQDAAISWALTIVLLVLGMAIFQRVERTVVDSV